jgi:p-aminobenzoyl-glutamate transporter AbgT
VLGLSTKLYLIALTLPATPDPKVIFIILIIILNLHDLSLSEFGCNIKPGALDMSLVARSCYKNAIIRKEKI